MTINKASLNATLGCYHLRGLLNTVRVHWFEVNGTNVLRCYAFGKVWKQRLKRRPKNIDVYCFVDVVAGRSPVSALTFEQPNVFVQAA